MALPVIQNRLVSSEILQNVGSVPRDPGLEQMQIMYGQITEFPHVYTRFTQEDTNVSFVYWEYSCI